MDIRELDVTDPAARRRWYDVQDRSARADRPYALLQAFDAFEVSVTQLGPYAERVRWEAHDGDRLVGVAELELPRAENLDLGWAEVHVLPGDRRRGVGRALWHVLADRPPAAGRTRVGGEVSIDLAVAGAGFDFSTAMGAVEKHREDHLVADLPVAPCPTDPAYELVTWRRRCPDEHREDYLAMRNQMNADVPVGELDLESTVLDGARLAPSEERLARSYDVRVAAARRRSDGVFGGYSPSSCRTAPTLPGRATPW